MADNEIDNEKVEEVHKLVKKNNQMIRKMYDAQRRAAFFRLLYWMVIIILAVIAYISIEPYIDQFEDLYTKVHSTSEQFWV